MTIGFILYFGGNHLTQVSQGKSKLVNFSILEKVDQPMLKYFHIVLFYILKELEVILLR